MLTETASFPLLSDETTNLTKAVGKVISGHKVHRITYMPSFRTKISVKNPWIGWQGSRAGTARRTADSTDRSVNVPRIPSAKQR